MVMWKVAAARGGVLFDAFKENTVVAIGWPRFGDLSRYRSRDELVQEYFRLNPDASKAKAAHAVGQLYRFVHEIAEGDRVLTYDPSRRVYLVGTIASDYCHEPALIEELPNIRRVKWEGEVSRDALSVVAKNSLGAISTLFRASDEAAADVERALRGEPRIVERSEEETEDEEILKEIEDRALEFIKDQVNSLDWEEMQELVAGLLRSMGYKTRVSPRGPDRGKDITASPDGFGFENPRIIVEVKHRPGTTMGSQAIRSFLGGRHPDDKGLYVSTGGFSKDAYYEAERANIPLTLMDIEDLVEAVLEQYEKMDIETQRLVPLKRIYWPM